MAIGDEVGGCGQFRTAAAERREGRPRLGDQLLQPLGTFFETTRSPGLLAFAPRGRRNGAMIEVIAWVAIGAWLCLAFARGGFWLANPRAISTIESAVQSALGRGGAWQGRGQAMPTPQSS